jgi:glycosyltransferase involved in cell wall biosynthesis
VLAIVGDVRYMDGLADDLHAAGATVRRVELTPLRERRGRFISACLDYPQLRRLVTAYRAAAPDVIHVNQQYDEDGWDLVMSAVKARIPFVGTIHLPMCIARSRHPFSAARGFARRLWFRFVDYPKILVSQDAGALFQRSYNLQSSCHVVVNGTYLETSSAPSAKPDLPAGWLPDDPVIGFCGQLVEQKDPLRLVDAWLQLRQWHSNVRLLLVGDGPLRQAIQQRAVHAGAEESLNVTGWSSQADQWLCHISVVAMTSEFEGMPLALVEAACAGKRIVAMPCSGVTDLLRRVPWATAANDRDPGAFAQLLAVALTKPLPDPDSIQGVRAYFSAARMAQETVDVYRLAIG